MVRLNQWFATCFFMCHAALLTLFKIGAGFGSSCKKRLARRSKPKVAESRTVNEQNWMKHALDKAHTVAQEVRSNEKATKFLKPLVLADLQGRHLSRTAE
ncbi:MAG: hypothetical protein QOE73_1168 [Verrucomicrobiota bacterium]